MSHPGTASTYDAIVIGAGHNGLTAAAYLARAGLSTLVLERREIVGGACVTEEIAPGCRASTTSYIASMLRPEVIRDLRLGDHGLRMVPCEPGLQVPFLDGEILPWWSDDRRTSEEIRRFSARDAADLSARPGRVEEAGPLPAAVLPRAAAGHPRARPGPHPRGAPPRDAVPADRRRRDRPDGGVPDREPGRLPRPQLRVGQGEDAVPGEQRVRQARRAVPAGHRDRAALPPAVRRRPRRAGLLRARHRRDGRDHRRDGRGGEGIRRGDPHRRAGRAHRHARRPRHRGHAGGRHRDHARR